MNFIFLSPGKSHFKVKWFRVREIAKFRKFRHSKSDVPVYILRKIHLTTREAIKKISEITGISEEKIGYAGLKDKYDETLQFISLPKKVDDIHLESLDMVFHGFSKYKLKPGMLDGNEFEITVSGNVDSETITWLRKNTIYNYFGLQRFGVERKNHIIGMKICKKRKRVGGMDKFFVNAYQSYLFNEAINILHPDVPDEIPLPGRDVEPLDVQEEIMRKDGVKEIPVKGEMRKTRLGPINILFEKNHKNGILKFSLPKSSYGTIVLGELLKQPFQKSSGFRD